MSQLNLRVFLLPFIVLSVAVVCSIIDAIYFVAFLDELRAWILKYFDWLFNGTVFCLVLLTLVIYFSPIGNLKIGGPNAQPIFSRVKWFAIVLCTTVATGILFWGCAEPLFHLHGPPSKSAAVFTEEAAVTAMSTMYMHWTFSPYAIYTVMSLIFAFSFYHFGLPFRVSSIVRIFSSAKSKWYHDAIDSICLFALVAGMAASLGAGVLTISGGLNKLLNVEQNILLWAIIVLVIVIAFISSAASGIKRGIKWLSLGNIILFIAMIFVFSFFLLDTTVLMLAAHGIGEYFVQFVPRSLGISDFDKEWERSWTSFYWANWMAWAPVSALFLGRISLGYTVREFIRINLVYTSLFSVVWMTLFGGISLSYDLINAGELHGILIEGGPQDIIFTLIGTFDWAGIASFIFLLIAFVSYVTAADSNTTALSGMSSINITKDQPDASLSIKVMWGLIIAVMAWVMVSFAGIEGIKILSVLGGFPVLFLYLIVIVIFVKLIFFKSHLLTDPFEDKTL